MLIGALSFPMYAQPRMTFAGSSSSAHSTTRAASATRIEGSMLTAKIERAKCIVTALAVSFSSARPTQRDSCRYLLEVALDYEQ